jgi:predicted nucleic acid-binding protein
VSTFVLDTSVAIAWYLPEVFADSARAWQGRMLEERLRFVVPTLHYWEFANVLRARPWPLAGREARR